IDSRLAWLFVNSAFKIYITCSPEVAALRVSADKVRTGEPGGSREEILKHLLERQKEENERFKLFYGADCHNLDNFDFVIDSSHSTVEEIATSILKAFEEKKRI
ncbi:MAG: (d)CMP kinase, partial [Alistipes sp.]|nr:(d)CMP kinase [Candidatus Minthomonas equi]